MVGTIPTSPTLSARESLIGTSRDGSGYPDFPNFFALNKPRVLLVTDSSLKPCKNPVGDHYLLKSIKNKIDYFRFHEIEIFYNMALLDAKMARF
ncbi:Xyloglucan 6-xylosyltransferase [Morus notabilis]|uniref:Xyloglucan 6-xylosyltransferase n=1 Tax=Morus notabilis TaxID=981085 RepID=W9QWA4_9ROSA|nr:Xyloglucan 6-xylosyltransferase [Morus notabilis]